MGDTARLASPASKKKVPVLNSRFLIVSVAGLIGAAGVVLGAVAAHRVQDPSLATAAQMLLFHAAAAVAVAAHLRPIHHRPVRGHRVWLAAAALMLSGSALFAGDITMRVLVGARLFPMAAPLGGSTMIAGWLGLAVAAIVSLRSEEK